MSFLNSPKMHNNLWDSCNNVWVRTRMLRLTTTMYDEKTLRYTLLQAKYRQWDISTTLLICLEVSFKFFAEKNFWALAYLRDWIYEVPFLRGLLLRLVPSLLCYELSSEIVNAYFKACLVTQLGIISDEYTISKSSWKNREREKEHCFGKNKSS